MLTELLSGQCDMRTTDGLSLDQAPFLIEAEASGLLVPYFQTGTVYEHIDFNINLMVMPPTLDFDVYEDVHAQAMTLCTDRQGMVDNIMYGQSEVISTYIPGVSRSTRPRV